MSTKINLTIGDQRLLQASKTRGAANQQALDDRTANKQTAATAEETIAAIGEERPGASLTTNTARRPTAQRKKKEQLRIYAGYQLASRQVAGTENTQSTVWGAPLVNPFTDQWDTRPITNVFSVETRTLEPGFADITDGVKPLSGVQALTIPLNTLTLQWTVRQYFSAPVGSSQFPSTRVGTPPTFPLTWENLRFKNAERLPIRSCTADAIYVSTYLRINNPTPQFLAGINDPNAYDLPIFPARTTTPVPGAFLQKSRSTNFAFNQQVFIDYGIYHKINLTNNTVQSRLLDVTQYSSYSTLFPAYNFYNNLDPADPQRILFRQFIETYPINGASENQLNIWAAGYNDYFYWPHSLNYNPSTGVAFIFADPPNSLHYSIPSPPPTERKLYTKTFDKNLTIPQIYNSLIKSTVYTDTVLEQNGFTFVKTVSSLSTFESVFPVGPDG